MDLGDLVVDEEAGGGLEAGARQLLELVVRSRLARLDRALCSPPRPATFTSLKLLWERLRWMRLWRPHSSWSGNRHRP